MEDDVASSVEALRGVSITRASVVDDVVHYAFDVRVGAGPNGVLRLHRIVRERRPGVPRRTSNAIMLMHGDFASFPSNFAQVLSDPDTSSPGVALWLAQHGVDVWGLDRRWTQAEGAEPDLSGFDAMGLEQELSDIGKALAVARAVRFVTSRATGKMILSGFSRGGALAYYYASYEESLPPWRQHLKGLVPIDVYASLPPEAEDLRQFYCGLAADGYAALDAGVVNVPNDFQIGVGERFFAAPDELNPFAPFDFPFPGATNRDLMLDFVGVTWFYFGASPLYHLNAPVLDDNGEFAIALRSVSENAIARWLADAPAHQSTRESADTDAILCDASSSPIEVPLSRIEVPLFLLGAAGGYGELAVFSTTEVSSTDVSSHIVRKLDPNGEAEDYGHADLLFADDAPELAWTPLLEWLQLH